MLIFKKLPIKLRASGTYSALTLIAVLGLSLHSPAVAQAAEESNVEPVNADAVGAIVSCAVCHGANGEGNAKLSAPRIGGMADWYLSRQLYNFRHGIRGATDDDVFGTQMRAMTLALDDMDEAEELARYLSTLTPPDAPKTISGDTERGKQLYTVCTACHGADGGGNKQLNSPELRGQFDWYLVRQLKNYGNGLRGADTNDTYGMQMAPMVETLTSEQDLIDVVAYINTL